MIDLFRIRLEFYEQSCAVDSTTKKCAGPPAECRAAMLGILGTELRTTCGCKGTDFTQLYDCLGWQRLLWVNPCVVQSQSDFHIKNAAIALAQMSTTPATTMHTIRLTTSWRAEIRRTTILPTTSTTMATIYTEPTRPTTELIPKPLPKTTTTTTTTTTSTVKPRKHFFLLMAVVHSRSMSGQMFRRICDRTDTPRARAWNSKTMRRHPLSLHFR